MNIWAVLRRAGLGLLAPLILSWVAPSLVTSARADPASTHANLLQVAAEYQMPAILLKAVAWQESGWTHLVNGKVYVSTDNGVGIMQLQDGDTRLNEIDNIRAGARALMGKWQLNVSHDAQRAVRALGGIDEDFDVNILENWWVPLAAYNGYSGSDVDGHGGGKGYARAIFSMLTNPSAYTNYRPDSGARAASVPASVLPYFAATAPLSDPFKIIPGYTGGSKSKIQAYTLCDLVRNRGRVHRWDAVTARMVDVTTTIEAKCKLGGGGSAGAKIIATALMQPSSIQAEQTVQFSAKTSVPARAVRFVFDTLQGGAIVELQNPTGDQVSWQASRAISQPGDAGKRYQRQVWTVAVGADGKEGAVYGPMDLVVTPKGGGTGPVKLTTPLQPMPSVTQSFANSLNYKTPACHFLGLHPGIDYAPVAVGQSVFAIAEGQVVKTGQLGKSPNSLGSYVVLDHPQLGVRSYYLHVVPAVAPGQTVSANQKIASIAATTAVGRHLHFEIQKSGFGIVDSYGKPKLFVGHSTTPIGNCGYVARQADLDRGWLDPAAFLKQPVVLAGSAQHTQDHDDVDAEDLPVLSEQKARAEVVALFLAELAKKNLKYAGSLDEQARAAGLITSTTLLRPQDRVTRMEVALFAHRVLEKHAVTVLPAAAPSVFPLEEFADTADVNAQAYQRVVNNLAAAGVIQGVRDASGELRFFPVRKASAAEVQAMVDRTLSKINTTPALGAKIVNTTVIPSSLEQNAKLTFRVTTDRVAERVVMVFQNPDAEVALTGDGTSFSLDRPITVAGSRPWRLRVYASQGVLTDDHVSGTLEVKPAGGGSQNASITAVQVEAAAMVNTPISVLLTGKNLSASVRVTLEDCENPQTQLLNVTQIRHQCVPRRAGQVAVGWKPDATVANPIVVGAVAVSDPSQAVGGAGSLSAKVDAFVATWTGKPVDVDKHYGYQCVDLMRQYAKDVLGLNSEFPIGNAYAIFVNTNSDKLRKIQNSPSAVPSKGDLIFWKPAPSNGQAGHVAIFVAGDARQFTSFDQNFCSNSGAGTGPCAPRLVTHSYDGVAGWITTKAPALDPVRIQSTNVSPAMVQVNQTMTFAASLSTAAGVAKVELVFPDAGVVEPMTHSGPTQWSRTRVMQQPGPARPYQIRVTDNVGRVVTAEGSFTVQAAAPAVQIQSVNANPASVEVGQTMGFVANLSTAAGMSKVELVFPDVGVLEPMVQTGATQWSRSRVMQQVGSGRQFQVRVTTAAGQVVTAGGGYSVQAAAPTVQIQSVNANPASVEVGQTMGFVANLSTAAGVSKVELVFPDVGVLEPMAQTGATQWSRSRVMQQVGSGRQFQVKVTTAAGQVVTAGGGYSVQAAAPTVQIQSVNANPASVEVGQTMGFVANLSTAAGVSKVELVFPDVGVLEPMAQTGATQWSRSRVMQQVGSGRQFQVRVTTAAGQVVTAGGGYSVQAAAPPQPVIVPPAAGCSTNFIPVCGVDGRTYSNLCTLGKYGVQRQKVGACS